MLETLLDGPFLMALFAVCVAGLVHGTLGIGFPLVSTPIIALATDVRTAILLTLVPTVTVNIMSILRGGRWRDSLGRHWPVAAMVLVGSVVGSRLLVQFDQTPFKLVLATVIFFYLYIHVVRGAGWSWVCQYPRLAGVGFGLFAGLVAGTSNVAVPVLIIYFSEMGLPTVALVQVLNLCFLGGKIAQLGVFGLSGHFNGQVLLASIPLAAAAAGALLVGNRFRGDIDRETHLRWLRKLLFVIAVMLVIQFLIWFLR